MPRARDLAIEDWSVLCMRELPITPPYACQPRTADRRRISLKTMSNQTTTALSSAGKTTEQTAGNAESFASLFEASISAGDFGKEGEIVKGTVVAVQRDNVVIDIGGKSEGIIALNEFADAQGQTHVKPGDKIDVSIDGRE